MKESKKVLILGGSSYVGRHLFQRLGPDNAIATYYSNPIENGLYFNSLNMGLADIVRDPQSISVAVILLGDTDPETCAADINKSQAVNVESIKSVLRTLRAWGIKPVFTSSEFVFDGKKGNYRENDCPNPILTYGRQKVEVEEFIKDNFQDYLILRLAKVYGSQPKDGTIFTNWLEAVKTRPVLECAFDQKFSPVYVDDVVEGIIRLVANNCRDIFHLSGPQGFRRIELLEILLDRIRKYAELEVKVVPRSINDFPLREKRPLDVSLVADKLVEAAGLKMYRVEEICEKIVRDFPLRLSC